MRTIVLNRMAHVTALVEASFDNKSLVIRPVQVTDARAYLCF